jgi:hypothetical protein
MLARPLQRVVGKQRRVQHDSLHDVGNRAGALVGDFFLIASV